MNIVRIGLRPRLDLLVQSDGTFIASMN